MSGAFKWRDRAGPLHTKIKFLLGNGDHGFQISMIKKKGISMKEPQIRKDYAQFWAVLFPTAANTSNGKWERALNLPRTTTVLVVYRNGKSIKGVLSSLRSFITCF